MRGVLVSRVRVVTALVAVGGLLLAGAAMPSPAAAQPGGPPAPEQPAPEQPVGGSPEAAAMSAAVATGEPVVVDELTTETRLVTADPGSGQLVAELSALPARVRDGSSPDAGWVDVDSTLRLAAGGSVRPVATAVELELSGGGDAPLARMADDGDWLALSWPGLLPEPVLDGSVATYPDAVGPGIDLVVQAGVVGFSHYLVVRDARAAGDPALARVSLGLTTSGLAATPAAGGVTNLAGPDGEPAFVVPPARMWDSAGMPAGTLAPAGTPAGARAGLARAVRAAELVEPDRAASAVMPVQVTGSQVTIEPDQALLRDPDTVFPVVIDPSYSDGDTYWTMVWSNGMSFPNSSSEQARVGYDGWSGQNKRSRVFYRFSTSVLRNREINSARFEHRQVHSPNHDCSLSTFGPAVRFSRSGSISSSTSWSGPSGNSSTYSTSRTVNGHSSACGGWTRTTFNAKAAVNYAASRGHSTLTVRLMSTNESDRNGWRRFANTNGFPKLIASYNSPPRVPTGRRTTSPSMGCASSSNRPWVHDNSPVLRATLSSASSQNLRGRFQRQRLISGSWGGTTTHVTSYGAQGERSDPHGGLPDGRYRWRVRAEDRATQSSFTGYCYFQLDTTPPPAPSLSISDPYRLSFWVEPDGRPQATLTVGRAGDTTVDRFRYAIGSGTPTTLRNLSGSTGTVTFTPPYGVTTVSARLVDKAGNAGPIATATLRVMSPRVQHAWVMNDGDDGVTADLPQPVDRGMGLQFGSGVSWDSGNRADLGGEAWDRALRFDGTGAGASTSGPAVFELDSFTITARVRVDSADPDDNRSFIAVSQDGNTNSAFRMGYALASDSWAVWRNSSEGAGAFSLVGPAPIDQVGEGGQPFPDGQPDWQHLAMVYDAPAGELRLYVDGDLAAERGYTFPAAAGGAFRIGRGKTGSGFEGLRPGRTDDVVVFDSALDEPQIRTLVGADTVADIDTQRDGTLDHGLAAAWSFGEGAGDAATDWSGHGHDLSLASGMSWVDGPDAADDPADRALHLDGTDQGYAQTAGPVIDTSRSHAISAWVRLTGTSTGTAGVATQAGTISGVPQNGSFLIYSSTDRWRFGKRRMDDLNYDTVYSFAPPARDQWVHLVGVFELRDPTACLAATTRTACGESRLYVDGRLQETRASTEPWDATGAFQLGRFINTSGEFSAPFRGDIDEVRVYERVLSPAEVRVLHAAGTGTPEPVNAPPIAVFESDCTAATCDFDASAAADPDGTIASYEWDFGDGATATGQAVSHTYTGAATSYDVTLVVTDDGDAMAERTQEVGGEPSVLVVTGPSGQAVTADDPVLDLTGELDLRVDVEPDTWTLGSRQVIASKADASEISWGLFIMADGGVSFLWSFNGTTDPLHFVGWPDAEVSGRTTLRVTLTSAGPGEAYVTLYVGDSMDGPWDHQGFFHRAEPPTVYASTAPLILGSNTDLWGYEFAGRIYQFQLYDGASGDLVADPDFTEQWPQATGLVGGAGRPWQVSGSAQIVYQ